MALTASHRWKFAQASPLLRSRSQELYLKLLAHPLLPVRTECYTWTLNVVKVTLMFVYSLALAFRRLYHGQSEGCNRLFNVNLVGLLGSAERGEAGIIGVQRSPFCSPFPSPLRDLHVRPPGPRREGTVSQLHSMNPQNVMTHMAIAYFVNKDTLK